MENYSKEKRMENKVACYNKCVKILKKIVDEVSEFLKEFEDKKVRMVDGSMVKKLSDKYREISNRYYDNKKVSVIIRVDVYNISVMIKDSFPVAEHGCNYIEVYKYLGKVENNLLTELYDIEIQYRTTTVKAVLKAEIEANKIKEKYNSEVDKHYEKYKGVSIIESPKRVF